MPDFRIEKDSLGEMKVPAAALWGREQGLEIIEGGCPLMFGPTADAFHRFVGSILEHTGQLPRKVRAAATLSGKTC